MTRRPSIFLCLLLSLLPLAAAAQDSGLLERIVRANSPSSARADFIQRRHSPLLEGELLSEGRLYLLSPDKLRYEQTKPVQKLSILDGSAARGRFRVPSFDDFEISLLQDGKKLSLVMDPRRRDLRQLFTRVVLEVDPSSLLVHKVLLLGLDGNSTLLEFKNLQLDVQLDESLFE